VTSGYVAKDLEKLVRLAVLHSLRELMAIDKKPMRQDHDDNELENLFGKMSLSDMDYESKCLNFYRSWKLKWDNFQYALSIMKPSQKVEFESVLPSRRWCDIMVYFRYEDLKRKIEKMVKLPLTHSDTYARLGLKPTSGLLLYGPSGCGKTILVQALVYESRMNVICVKGPSICSKYFGETENIIRNLFKTARKISPCIIFFDEIDSIASRRDWNDEEGNVGVGERVLSTLLNEMDGIQELNDVLVIGCTNRPDRIDDALVRPGRIDQSLYVGLPNKDERTDILK
ncbi:15719_t:CDS:2, partial [Acaulospora morrowiae]